MYSTEKSKRNGFISFMGVVLISFMGRKLLINGDPNLDWFKTYFLGRQS